MFGVNTEQFCEAIKFFNLSKRQENFMNIHKLWNIPKKKKPALNMLIAMPKRAEHQFMMPSEIEDCDELTEDEEEF